MTLFRKYKRTQVQVEKMEKRLTQLRHNARRSVPDWPECVHVSLTENVTNHWGAVLATLAGKLVHDNKPAMEMAIASPEPGVRAVWVRTG